MLITLICNPLLIIRVKNPIGPICNIIPAFTNTVYPAIIRFRRGDHYGHGGGGQGGGQGGGHHGHGYAYLGPVHTFAKTDYHANFKWGVRHLAGGPHGYHG